MNKRALPMLPTFARRRGLTAYASQRELPALPALRARNGVSFDILPSALARWNSALAPKGAAEQEDEEDNTISILAPIGNDFWGEGVTARRIAAALRYIGDRDVVVNINSPGGDVFEGFAIYNLLRDHKRNVTTRVIGMAASAGSIIAMAGDRIEIARAGFMMMHNVWVLAMGNRHELRDAADWLEPFDDALADLYAARSGMEKKAVAKLLDKETWMNGTSAIEQGFADDLLPADLVEERDADKAENLGKLDVRALDIMLAKCGMSRNERRDLLAKIKGATHDAGAGDEGDTHDAVTDGTHDAAELGEVATLMGSVAAQYTARAAEHFPQ